jgi:hypothetical protein
MCICSYKDYSSLNMWQANWVLLIYLLSAIYYSVITHLQKGKKISFLLPGDVNLGPVPQDEACFITVLIVR